MWEFLTTVFTTLINKEGLMVAIVLLFAGIIVGASGIIGYLSYCGSTLKWKKDKVV